MRAPGPGDAHIVVDVQNDFLPVGAPGRPVVLGRGADAAPATSLPGFP